MALKKNPKVDLKLKYERVFETSMILALAFLIIAFKFFPTFEKEDSVFQAPQELVNVEDIVNTKQEAAPPPPPKPPIPIEAPSDEVLEDIEIAETELDVDADVGAPPPPPVEEEEEDAEPVFFVAVEELPEPIGGIEGIQKKITYPEIARRAGVQGMVTVMAFVDENGNVAKVELMKGIGAGCDEEAMKAVQKTKFNPGMQRGKPVKVRVALPIRFKLQ
ncbi:MAG: energy transducer TonB [Melioribacteraceae bacterium]|nr:energy transducer TonB [Melioribacteraceae bacterium]MCF8353952.1 energy transducer TonB [Melioribacteraceae bacterium]MCF8393680.1 energy transducer TonB [Melioribacteraceae bacterium]MCF8419578.1 energy transducer TonB [Melioribacteraceae bacterium]